MNGQPTAQNTHECGGDGDLPGFRNWSNDDHVADLARVWNVEPSRIPHYGPPTHALQMKRYAENGSILEQDRLFLVVQDLYLTETAQLADVVLPTATWGEKTGTFTNVDRTVHLSEKAVDPPGKARAELDIYLDYARRLNLRDKDGAPWCPGMTRSRRSRPGRSARAGGPATTRA